MRSGMDARGDNDIGEQRGGWGGVEQVAGNKREVERDAKHYTAIADSRE